MGTIADLLNTAMRDFQRYSGDGLPGEPVGRPLPVGDPASGQHNPPKKQVREALLAIAETADDLTGAAAAAAGSAELSGESADTSIAQAAIATAQAGVANTAASEATLAAIAAGANLVTTLTGPTPSNGSIELLQTGAGTQIHEVQTGEWVQIGWLGIPVFPTIEAMAEASGFVHGQYVDVELGDNGQMERFAARLTGDEAELEADGALIVPATGMGGGRLISQRTTFSSFAEFIGDRRRFAAGKLVTIRNTLAAYKATSTAGNLGRPNAGSQEFDVLKTVTTSISVAAFGAIGDQVADDKLAIQAAINKFTNVSFPEGNYLISGALVQSRRNVITGEGRSSRIVSFVSDIFWVGVAGGVSDQSVFSNIALVSGLGGGHIFTQKQQVIAYEFSNLYCEQQNDGKSIYTHTENLGNHVNNTWRHGKYIHTYTATEPAFKFVVSSAAGATNVNKWSELEIVRGSKPWFYFESNRENNYIYDVVLEDILTEVPLQGIAACYGVNGFEVNRMKVYDLINQQPEYSVSTDLFLFTRGTNASSQPSRNITIREYSRTDADAALNGFLDFRFASASGGSAQGVEFYGCGRNIVSDILADLTNALDVTIYSSRISVSGTNIINLSRYDAIGYDGAIEPSQFQLSNQEVSMSADLVDFALEKGITRLRISPTGPGFALRSIKPPVFSGFSGDPVLFVTNMDATNSFVVANVSTGSGSAKINTPDSMTVTVPPRGGMQLVYDRAVARWFVLSSAV